MDRRTFLVAAFAAGLAALPGLAQAQAYPTRPTKLMPGLPVDVEPLQ